MGFLVFLLLLLSGNKILGFFYSIFLCFSSSFTYFLSSSPSLLSLFPLLSLPLFSLPPYYEFFINFPKNQFYHCEFFHAVHFFYISLIIFPKFNWSLIFFWFLLILMHFDECQILHIKKKNKKPWDNLRLCWCYLPNEDLLQARLGK